MPRKIQTSYTRSRARTASFMGDSLTRGEGLGVQGWQFFPEATAIQLRALGVPVRARNFGISGNTTTQMLARFSAMTQFEVPDLGVIMGGVNDPSNSIPGATTQGNLTAMVQALLTAGCPRVVVVSTQYLNYSDNSGDTPTVPYSTYATVRTYQAAAAASFAQSNPGQVAYCDLYGFQKALVVAGTVPQATGWASFHVAGTNQHPSAQGAAYYGQAVVATVQAQAGWVAALAS